MENTKLNVVMIGAGRGGSQLLPILMDNKDISLLGIAEVNPSAPGLEMARRWKIPITADFKELVAKETVDVIIDLTGDPFVAKEIYRFKKPHSERLGGKMAKIIWNIIEDRNRELRSLKKEVTERYGLGNIIGKSERMQEVFQVMKNIAETETTILIEGETGTGKELVAKAIHYMSFRKDRPFVAVNCAAFPPDLLESELFGHERGSFTGAIGQRKGMFELANGGTLFLDEVGTGSVAVQLELLRVLQEQKFRRVGGTVSVDVDVRIIAATNVDLIRKIEAGLFRQDLYYRLNVIPIKLPALRERFEDLPLLIDYFLEIFSTRHHREIKTISPETLQVLYRHSWPGNIRELENLIERVVVTCPEGTVTPEWLPEEFAGDPVKSGSRAVQDFVQPTTLETLEREAIRRVMTRNKGHRSKTAQQLGITRKVLWTKIKKYHLQ
jgi:transcriptional regulator with PAS, ATPase and Fis domain